jgi:hypothetical protein
MTEEQFIKAWAKAGLVGSPKQRALRMVMVDRMSVEDASRRSGVSVAVIERHGTKLTAAFRSMDWTQPDGRRR